MKFQQALLGTSATKAKRYFGTADAATSKYATILFPACRSCGRCYWIKNRDQEVIVEVATGRHARFYDMFSMFRVTRTETDDPLTENLSLDSET